MFSTTSEYVWQNITPRPRDAHKGTFGSVLVVAGSASYRGAAALAVEGALRTGAGIVTLASVEPVLAAVAAACPSAVSAPAKRGPRAASRPRISTASGGRRPLSCWRAPGWAIRPRARPVPPRPGRW